MEENYREEKMRPLRTQLVILWRKENLPYSSTLFITAVLPINVFVCLWDLSSLAWRIPWTEKPGGLQSMGSWRVAHDWINTFFSFMNKDWTWGHGRESAVSELLDCKGSPQPLFFLISFPYLFLTLPSFLPTRLVPERSACGEWWGNKVIMCRDNPY